MGKGVIAVLPGSVNKARVTGGIITLARECLFELPAPLFTGFVVAPPRYNQIIGEQYTRLTLFNLMLDIRCYACRYAHSLIQWFLHRMGLRIIFNIRTHYLAVYQAVERIQHAVERLLVVPCFPP